MHLHNLNRGKIEWTSHFSRVRSDKKRVVFVPENPPKKAKKSEKLTIAEKNPPKKPPHISEKVLFAPDCFSLCQSALAGLVGLCYNEGGWRRQSHRQPIRCFGTCTGALVGRPVLFYCLSMISCNRLRNSSRLSHSLASISSSGCALDFRLHNPATSYSPRCSPMCWIRHRRRTWGNLTKYNVGRWLENDLEEGPDGRHKEKAPDIV